MGKGKAPTPPDPKETAAASTGTNIGTAIANNQMGLLNQSGPYGALNYEQTGTYAYTDPYTGQTYDIPKFSATTTLAPDQQALLDKTTQGKMALADAGIAATGRLSDALTGPISNTATEDRLAALGRARLDPQFDQASAALDAKLANQGILPGSEAYNREKTLFAQNRNDAYNQLYLTGNQQAFNQGATERQMALSEALGLNGAGSPTMPQVSMSQPQGAATTDVAGLINANYNQRLQNYQMQQAQTQSLLGGLFGLGAGALSGGYI